MPIKKARQTYSGDFFLPYIEYSMMLQNYFCVDYYIWMYAYIQANVIFIADDEYIGITIKKY